MIHFDFIKGDRSFTIFYNHPMGAPRNVVEDNNLANFV